MLCGKFTLLMGKAFIKFFSRVRVAFTNALFYVKTAVSVCTCMSAIAQTQSSEQLFVSTHIL